jgi:hypothetical protein
MIGQVTIGNDAYYMHEYGLNMTNLEGEWGCLSVEGQKGGGIKRPACVPRVQRFEVSSIHFNVLVVSFITGHSSHSF